jgi:hypothetical protein
LIVSDWRCIGVLWPSGQSIRFRHYLIQPEGHVHLAVHCGDRDVLVSLRAPASAPVELGEAEVAMRDEGTHAKVGRAAQGFAIERVGTFACVRAAVRDNVTEQSKDPRLVAPLALLSRESQGLFGDAAGLVEATGETVAFGEVGEDQ